MNGGLGDPRIAVPLRTLHRVPACAGTTIERGCACRFTSQHHGGEQRISIETPPLVIPAKAGIQPTRVAAPTAALGTGLRRYDGSSAGAFSGVNRNHKRREQQTPRKPHRPSFRRRPESRTHARCSTTRPDRQPASDAPSNAALGTGLRRYDGIQARQRLAEQGSSAALETNSLQQNPKRLSLRRRLDSEGRSSTSPGLGTVKQPATPPRQQTKRHALRRCHVQARSAESGSTGRRGRGIHQEHGVKTLVWYEVHESMESAIAREKAIKEWRREWKASLIEKQNPEWRDLYAEII